MGDFGTYVTQEVVVPQEPEHDEEPVQEGTLIDTTEDIPVENHNTKNVSITSAAYQEIIDEKEFLKTQCDKLRYLFSLVKFL